MHILCDPYSDIYIGDRTVHNVAIVSVSDFKIRWENTNWNVVVDYFGVLHAREPFKSGWENIRYAIESFKKRNFLLTLVQNVKKNLAQLEKENEEAERKWTGWYSQNFFWTSYNHYFSSCSASSETVTSDLSYVFDVKALLT